MHGCVEKLEGMHVAICRLLNCTAAHAATLIEQAVCEAKGAKQELAEAISSDNDFSCAQLPIGYCMVMGTAKGAYDPLKIGSHKECKLLHTGLVPTHVHKYCMGTGCLRCTVNSTS